MTEEKNTILIIEDDLDVSEMLNAYFRVQEYEVLTVHRGEEGIQVCQNSRPDLVILDIRLPDVDGFEVARRLRGNRRTADIPIIFLTERREREDRLLGLELGADDYITKPFDVQELRLRVRNALRRNAQEIPNNPITDLPEGVLIDERLEDCLKEKSWAMLKVSIQNLEVFREAYGFVASDDALRAVSLMIVNSVRDLGSPNDFIGHLANTDLIVVTRPATLASLADRIQASLDQSLEYFYPIKDRGDADPAGDRLAVRISKLKSNDGPFKDLERLKNQLLRLSS